MKNLNKALVSALLLFILPVVIYAAEFRAGQQSSLTPQEKIAENLYMVGGTVTSAGAAEKDVLIAGGTVLVSGPIAEDLSVVGGNITILSQVSGDVRVGGGNITISGDIGGDVLIGGGQIILASKSIGGDVAMAGGTVRIDSQVKGNVKIAGGEIYINAPIDGNVNIKAEKLTLGSGADIKGNLVYEAMKPASMESGAKVQGKTTFTEIKNKAKKSGVVGFLTFALFAKFLMLLVTALLVGLIFRKYSKELVEQAVSNPLKELGRGIITIIVLPVLSIILLVTIIGIPLGILGLLSFIMLFIYGGIVTPIFLGSLVYKWISKKSEYTINWKTILLGVIIYLLLGLIPFLGWIAICVSVLITLGATLNIKSQILKEWR
ncbi:hypothetical protein C4565_02775 [Candidatus Parcubacteria bacterium]|jgi:cytoskeletal protein CcmA (bactofilin family)|nr:MAG: hypothetical protein C4565_02775 [Candidatus Parcubacteria bacterium]